MQIWAIQLCICALLVCMINVVNGDATLSLKVLGYNRPASLERLLHSLLNANYEQQEEAHVNKWSPIIPVDIYLDAAKDGSWRHDKDLILRNRNVASDFSAQWTHGPVTLHVRSKNAGLAHQWFEMWYPLKDDEYTLVLEDDLEVSPYYYHWLIDLISFYRYGEHTVADKLLTKRIAGITLQKAEVVAAQGWSPFQQASDESLPPIYGFQQPGSWGQLFFPERWRDFRLWLEAIQGDADANHDDARPFRLPGSPSHTGLEGSHLESEWTAAWMRFIYERGYFVVYSHLPANQVLCLNHLEPGEHYKEQGQVLDVLLMEQPLEEEIPQVRDLDVFNIWGILIDTSFNNGELLEYPVYNAATYTKGYFRQLTNNGLVWPFVVGGGLVIVVGGFVLYKICPIKK